VVVAVAILAIMGGGIIISINYGPVHSKTTNNPMKTKLTRKTKQMASALLTTLVICTILSMFVMYYLSLIDQQSYLSGRSQVWNMAIGVSEAGIEDGLAEINASLTYPNITGDGWYGSNNVFTRTNTLPEGSTYVATIITTNIYLPAVVCRGYVYSIPKYVRSGSSAFFAAVGVNTPANAAVTRTVSVICKRDSLFNSALAAKRASTSTATVFIRTALTPTCRALRVI